MFQYQIIRKEARIDCKVNLRKSKYMPRKYRTLFGAQSSQRQINICRDANAFSGAMRVTIYTRRLAKLDAADALVSIPESCPIFFLFLSFPWQNFTRSSASARIAQISVRLAGVTHGIRLSRMKHEEDRSGRSYVRELQTT